MAGQIQVYVNTNDVLDSLDDKDILAEVKARKLDRVLEPEQGQLKEVHEELCRGRNSAALALLERILFGHRRIPMRGETPQSTVAHA